MKKAFRKKSILVIGGTGSIGSEIVRQLIAHDSTVIRVLSNDEDGLFKLQEELKEHGNLRFLYGDIRDKSRIQRAIEGIDIVFHAAALKHVPLCEYNPFEAIQTNVIGTQNIIEVSLNEEVDKMIMISTDKAVNPINTMGATKLLAEKIMSDANHYAGLRKTKFSSVRFGNVLSSRGSVLHSFRDQIKAGGPVTLTSLDMTRYIMSINQSVDLVLKAVTLMQGGEIFVLKAMDSLKIKDLAEVMITELGPIYGYKDQDIQCKVIGLRPGEKLHELLMTENEYEGVLETEEMLIIPSKRIVPFVEVDESYPLIKVSENEKRSSDKVDFLTKKEIKNLLSNAGFFEREKE